MGTNLDTLNSKNFSVTALKLVGGPSVPLKYTVDIFTGIVKNTLGTTLAMYMKITLV